MYKRNWLPTNQNLAFFYNVLLFEQDKIWDSNWHLNYIENYMYYAYSKIDIECLYCYEITLFGFKVC